MKKSFTILLVFFVNIMFSQQEVNLKNLILYELKIKGITNSYLSDYAARLLEKNNVAVFAAFDSIENGYVIVEKDFYLHECKKYLENCDYGFKVTDTKKVELTENEFLKIYQLRGKRKHNEKPEFIQLGPKNELSNSLYKIAKDAWIKLYPEEYKKAQNSQQITPEELKIIEMKKQNR